MGLILLVGLGLFGIGWGYPVSNLVVNRGAVPETQVAPGGGVLCLLGLGFLGLGAVTWRKDPAPGVGRRLEAAPGGRDKPHRPSRTLLPGREAVACHAG